MSDAKKTGSRDISELKQRLGLKKGAAAPSSTTGQNARQNGASGGVVAPPGLSLPPPPGVAQSAPQPAIPNAADDPFAAMNAMAAVGTVQRAPEIVIVNDGKPVEQVGATRGTLLKIIVPSVLALGVGVAIGSIGKSASFYNDGIAGAKVVLGAKDQPTTFLGLRKTLSDLDTLLDQAKNNAYRPDPEVTKKLVGMAKRLEISDNIYKTRAGVPDADMAAIVEFYGGIAEIKSMIEAHVKLAAQDDNALAEGKKKSDAATLKPDDNATLVGKIKYGVIISGTDPSDFGAHLVELGHPYCGGKPSQSATCPDGVDVTGVAMSEGKGGWSPGELATPSPDSVATKKVLTIVPNGVSDALLMGADAGASQTYYVKRMRALVDRVQKLLKDSEKVESSLNSAATAKTRFSFFM